MGDILLYAIVIFATFRALEFVATFVANCRQRYVKPEAQWLPVHPLPEEYVPEFPGLFAELENLGFVLQHFRTETSMNRGGKNRVFAVFWHSKERVWAHAESLTAIAGPIGRGLLRFETVFSDDFSLVTLANMAHFFIGSFPRTESWDVGAISVQDQFRRHADRAIELVALHGSPHDLLSVEDLSSRWHAKNRAYLEEGLKTGTFRAAGPEEFKLSFFSAAQVSFRLLSGLRAKRNRYADQTAASGRSSLPSVADDLRNYLRWKEERERTRVTAAKGQAKGLLVVSGILFLLSMSREGGGLLFALLLLLVVFFHELGHVWAMRLVGHKDTQILFIPFLGALAMSRESLRTSPWQRVFILLMGPLPGMALAWLLTSLSLYDGSEIMLTLTSLLLVVNYANLLPLVPLDGGRVLAEALAGLGVVVPMLFQFVGLCVLAFLMISTGSWVAGVLFAALSLSYLLNLKGEYCKAVVVQKLRRQKRLPEEDLAGAALAALHQHPRLVQNAMQRYLLVSRIEKEVGDTLPTWVGRIGIFLVCVLSLTLPALIWYLSVRIPR